MPTLADILKNGDYYLDINGKSRHLGTDEKFNEDNKGFGITAQKDGKFLTAGGYNNSYNKLSMYAGGGYKMRFGNKDLYVDPGFIAGLVSGYENKLSAMAMPMVSFGNRLGKLNMMYAPKVKDHNPATLMFNYSIPFK